MKQRIQLATLALALLLVAPAAGADDAADSRKKAIDSFVEQFVDLAMFDGSILVDIGGEIFYERSFGYAHYEHRVAHSDDTRFRVASVSKAMTDVAVAKMIERGTFTLETSIAKYLPDFPSADLITIGHLMNHTSGIPHTNRQPWGDGTLSLTIDEIVERLSELPLDYPPGTDSGYSNGGYAVAAKILELAGGGTISEVMRATVFDPLGMKNTDHITDTRTPIDGMATGYEPGFLPGQRRHPRFYAFETRPGGGSFYSTKGDVLRFARGLFRDDFVREPLRRAVLGEDDDGYLAQGRSPGYVAKLLYDAPRDIIVVSVGNSYAVPADWAMAIADLASGEVTSNPWPAIRPTTEAISAEDPRIGRYRSSRGGSTTTIELDPSGALMISGPNGARNAAVPLVGGAFLQPIYFQLCTQNPDTRVIVCKMLSGEERYTSTLEPLGAAD